MELKVERVRAIAWSCTVCGVVLCLASSGAAQQASLPNNVRSRMEDTISKFMASTKAPGVAAAAVLNGQEVWSEGFGMADLENSVPVTPQTLFRLASVSKPITAMAALELWERHQLDLDAPVQKYCAAFPQKEFPISTRQLLGHLGGIRHYRSESEDDVEAGNTKHFDDPIAGGLQFFAKDPLVAKPGTKFSYTTHGFTLVGCAIEGASSRKYVEFVRDNVFTPAGMVHTRWDDRFAIIPYRTRFYSKSKAGDVQNAAFLDASYKIPGGGWLSSADDMAKFEIAVLSDLLMKRATLELMWTPQSPLPENFQKDHRGYGLGWGTGTVNGVSTYGHDGGQQGTSTVIIVAPEKNAGIVALINMDGLDSPTLGTDLMKILLESSEKSDSEKTNR
jgi:serine beta-lactamase-like protein LACTB, mitochondrial